MKKILSYLSLTALFLVSVVCMVKGDHVSPAHLADALKFSFHPSVAAVPLVVMDNSRMRSALERVTALASKVGNFIIAPGYINSELVIANNTTLYNFEVRDLALQSGSNPRPLVRGVKDNDIAFVYEIGLFIDSRIVNATNVYPIAYPNYQAFTASGATPSSLQAFYNGEFSAQVGQTVFVENYSTRNFEFVPRTQQSSSTNLSEWSVETATKFFDPYLIVSGKSDNRLAVAIKTYSGFAAAATTDNTENVLSLYMNTIIVRNGANSINNFMSALNAGPSAQG